LSKKKRIKKFTVTALAAALALSGYATLTPQTKSVKAKTTITSDQILSSLSPEQRRAIKAIEATSTETGLQLPSTIDLSSKEEISVIVEFRGHVAKTALLVEASKGKKLELSDAQENVEKEHAAFQTDLEQLNIKGKVTGRYKEAFNGVAIKLPAKQVKNLLDSKVVKNIWENKQAEVIQPVSNSENKNVVGSVYTGKHPHALTGVDKLHERGLTGKGVKVAVLDTGIDYNHPDLKDAYKGGYDFVDEDADPMETTYEDWKASGKPEFYPSAYYTAHGTHVSGILAGSGKNDFPLSVEGVAPEAELHVYRVLGPYGRGWDEDIIQGIDQAIKDKMDIMNLSLGNILNDPLSPLSVAINNAVIAGVTTFLAAGNEGPGLYSVGSPSSSPLGITVGSTDTHISYPNFNGQFKSPSLEQSLELRYSTSGLGVDPRQLKGQTLEVVNAGGGLEEDYEGLEVKGKIVLFTAGGNLRVSEKAAIAKGKGAKAAFSFSNYPGFIADNYPASPHFIPTFILEGTTAMKIAELLKKEEATFTFTDLTEQLKALDDRLSFFSSSGPTRVNYDIKPEIVAPGANILSTVPKYYEQVEDYKDSYAKFSGTSMATPHAAGIGALLLEANDKMDADDMKSVLMNTADDLELNYSVFDMGAGKVDAVEAIEARTHIQVIDKTTHSKNGKEIEIDDITGSLSFGTKFATEADIQEERTVTVENTSDQAKTFAVAVSFNVKAQGSKDGVQNGVQLKTPETINLKSGETAKTMISLLIPHTAENGNYEGYVTYTNKDNADEVYQVPFAVRKVKEGIDFLQSGNTFSPIRENGFGRITNVNGSFSLNSHMRTVDIFLMDADQNKEIGFIGSLDGRFIKENTPVTLGGYFKGDYYPFTNNEEQPIARETKMAGAGSYKMKFVFTDDQGKQIVMEKPVVIDREIPKVTTDVSEKIIEVASSTTSVKLNGQVEDSQIEASKALGIDVKQGANKAGYKSEYGYLQNVPVNENGEFSVTTSFPTYKKVIPVRVVGTDRAGLDSVQKEYFYVKDGTTYLATIPSKEEAKTGEDVSFMGSLHNGDSWKELTFNYSYNKEALEIKSVNLSDPLKDKVEVTTAETASGISVTLISKDGSAIQGDKKADLITVDTQLKNRNFFNHYVELTASSLKITDATGTVKTIEGISPSLKVWSSFSEITADMNGEAVFARDGFNNLITKHINYEKLGATIKAVDQSGTTYDAKVIDDGRFRISNLSSTQEEMNITFKVPGHFTVLKSFHVGREEAGYGEQKGSNFYPALAGDPNNDEIIDIRDAVYLQEHWGTADREGDINFDGTVDMKDMAFIEKNFLTVNPSVQVKDKPVDKYKNQTLEDLINTLK
jgi:subtilisin family serine protease